MRTPRGKNDAPRSGSPRGGLPGGDASGDRGAQVAGEIRRALQAEFARGLNDPRVQGMVSITDVVLTPDFSTARVRVSVMPEDRSRLTLSGLQAATGFLRRRLMDGTRIGRVPRIEFDLDDRLKKQAALDAALRQPDAGSDAPGTGETAGEITGD